MSESLLNTLRGPQDLKRLPIDCLDDLAAEIREAICGQVSRSGGHLAPNLGVVELTIALHYVFDFSHDRLLLDVGHQCYPHKLITGRQALLDRLRQTGGMAGFPDPRESDYDLFSVGHAGTAISTAVGMARGDQLRGEGDRHAVALVGDSSIVNGVALEGINNAGTLNRQFLVVLNDNGMSIGHPQGALAATFDKARLHPSYKGFKQRSHEMLHHLPGGPTLEEVYHRLAEMTKAAIGREHLFERFGLLCVGPVDGHDLPTLIEMFTEVKDIERPVLVHCKTIKGKGFDFSTDDPTRFHSPKPFRVEGCRVELETGGRSFTAAFAEAMAEMLEEDASVTAVTAGMPDGTGLDKLIPAFPRRVLDVGIAESHAVDMCAGMARAGLKPFAVIYSTFLQRAFDQVFQEVALQGLPVRLCLDRAGLVGGDGAVHHGIFDIAYLRSFPGMVLSAAMDEPTLRAALRLLLGRDAGPTALRYPRDNVAADPVQADTPPFVVGQSNLLAEGSDLAIVTYGVTAYDALAAREQLQEQGYSVAVHDGRFAKPVDIELFGRLLGSGQPVLTVEDHALAGGFGSCVLEACHEQGLPTQRLSRLGLADRWIHHGGRREQLAEAGIDAAAIARRVREMLDAPAQAPQVNVDLAERRSIRPFDPA